MVAPEIDEHLVELAGRIDCADDLGVLQFGHGEVRTSRGFTPRPLRQGRAFVLGGCRIGRSGGRAHLLGIRAIDLPLFIRLLLIAEILKQLCLAHGEDVELGEFSLERGIVDGLGVQLLAHIRRQAHLLDPLHVPGARTVAEAIEDVDDHLSPCKRLRLVIGGS